MTSVQRMLDIAVAVYSARRSLFERGPGEEADLAWALRPPDEPPAHLTPSWGRRRRGGRGIRLAASFPSPVAGRLPERCREARVEILLPTDAPGTPVCVHLCAAGEQGLARRRRLLARPLLARGIGSVLLENPFYGRRRPAGQRGAAVRTVADMGLMARAAVEEARALLAWLRRDGFQPGVAGVSMGAHLAAITAASVPFPVATALFMPARTPAPVLLDGELRRMVDWGALELAWGRNARAHLRCLLELSDVRRLPPPLRPDAAVIVAAAADAISPLASAAEIHAHWPGSELRVVRAGHVGAVVFHHRAFQRAVEDAFARLR